MATADDPALTALTALVDALTATEQDLVAIRARAALITERRAAGASYRELVTAEEPPLIVQLLADVHERLNQVGADWRRQEAQALHAEGLSMDAIAELFGVTRQRVSALLRR